MYLNRKTQEISLALIKIAVGARRAEFRRRLEVLALDILESVGAKEYEAALVAISVLRQLVEFGRTIYEIEPINAKILLEEFGNLETAIRQSSGIGVSETGFADIHNIFTSKESAFQTEISGNRKLSPYGKSPAGGEIGNSEMASIGNFRNQEKPEKSREIGINYHFNHSKSGNTEIGNSGNRKLAIRKTSVSNRQSAIVEKIKQAGNQEFPLKALAVAFPEVSEKTIRNDLRKICEQGILVKSGTTKTRRYRIKTQ